MDFNFDSENRSHLIKKILIKIFIWAAQIAAVIFLAYIIIFYAVEKTNMIGTSMENGLQDQDAIIIDKFTYHFNEPKRFDVIVFKQSGREHSYYNVKRVIGLPGERIQIKEDGIYINGELIEDIVDAEPMVNYGLAKEELLLEENEYFVLGDNRNNSEDSRFASIGNVRREEIVGRAFLRLSPFNFVNKLNLKVEMEED
ncbi:MAG: signal peptidase I [Clostridiales bacterium]|nr:signal peptidase I [Clostridiales bacterium]